MRCKRWKGVEVWEVRLRALGELVQCIWVGFKSMQVNAL